MTFPNNPIATAEQCAHELKALEIFHHPTIRQQYESVKEFWLNEVKPSADMRDCFDWAFEEVMFGAVVWALNQDPLHPKVITISRLGHTLNGKPIPGSRWGIDNPDSVYRVIPISGDQRYEIHGRVYKKRMVENYFTLWDPNMQTVGLLSGKDLVVDDDGRFVITVDSDAAEGRINHIQSCESAHEFYIRDVLADWGEDRVNELIVKRLGEADRGPRSDAELIQLASDYMHKWAANTTRWNNQALLKPVNEFAFTIDRDSDGALRNQIYIMGHFKLPDDDAAMLLTIDMGGAEYFIAPITNVWGTTNTITSRNGCLNMSQSQANADGSYTFVVAKNDPGIANWLDPSDMNEGILTLRWAEFPNDQPADTLGVKCEMTNLNDIDSLLPTDIKKVSAAERETLSKARAQSYAWRLADS